MNLKSGDNATLTGTKSIGISLDIVYRKLRVSSLKGIKVKVELFSGIIEGWNVYDAYKEGIYLGSFLEKDFKEEYIQGEFDFE